MKLYRILKIISGILLTLSSVSFFVLMFSEPESIVILFRFGIDIGAENFVQAITEIVLEMVGRFLLNLFLAIIYFVLLLIIGLITIFVRKGKGLIIFVIILTCISLFFEIRALAILVIGEVPSMILPIKVASDAVILGISIYNLIVLSKDSEIIDSTITQ